MPKYKNHHLLNTKENFIKRSVDKIHKAILPQHFVEGELIRIEKLNEEQRAFYKIFQQYLADEREKKIEDIKNAINLNKTSGEFLNFGRIVRSRFSQDPLNGSGSVMLPPGGRFNFGKHPSHNNYFIGIYFANSYETAFAEKFHKKSSDTDDTSLSLSLIDRPDSFSYYRVNIELDSYLDITSEKTLDDFFATIKDINVPKHLKSEAKRLKISSALANSVRSLRNNLLDPLYTQAGIWLDQNSTSQWFGHYVRLSGVQGILYPSVRNGDTGKNLVIFPENILGTEAKITLTDDCPSVPVNRKFIDKSNCELFTNLT